MDDFTAAIMINIFVVFFIVLLVFVIRWCINDAKLRGKTPVLVVVAVVLFFPWGLIAWLLFRPEPPTPPFNLEHHRTQ